MYTFIELPIFSRYASDYFSDDELAQLQIALSKNPKQGDVVLLTVYAKSAQENIATSTLNALRELADHAEII